MPDTDREFGGRVGDDDGDIGECWVARAFATPAAQSLESGLVAKCSATRARGGGQNGQFPANHGSARAGRTSCNGIPILTMT